MDAELAAFGILLSKALPYPVRISGPIVDFDRPAGDLGIRRQLRGEPILRDDGIGVL